MKFCIVPSTREGIINALKITAENKAEVRAIIEHFRLDPFDHMPEMEVGGMDYLHHAYKRDNGEWFQVKGSLGSAWVEPYLDLLHRVTGYTLTECDTIPLRPHGKADWLLCHTHIEERTTMDAGGVHSEGYQRSQDWNGKTAKERAPGYFLRCLRSCYGKEDPCPEFIQAGNNHYVRNPEFSSGRDRSKPGIGSESVVEDVFNWWLANKATEAQKEIWAKAEACYRSVCRSSYASSLTRNYERGIRVAWDGEGSMISFEDFQKV